MTLTIIKEFKFGGKLLKAGVSFTNHIPSTAPTNNHLFIKNSKKGKMLTVNAANMLGVKQIELAEMLEKGLVEYK